MEWNGKETTKIVQRKQRQTNQPTDRLTDRHADWSAINPAARQAKQRPQGQKKE